MRAREIEFPFVPTAEERARSSRVIEFWLARPKEWDAQVSLFDEEWSIEAIDRKEHGSEDSHHFAVYDLANAPWARLTKLTDYLLASRPPLELPAAERGDCARWILFAERAMSDPDLEMYGATTCGRPAAGVGPQHEDGRTGGGELTREEVRWGLDSGENRLAWAERVEEAVHVLAAIGASPEGGGVAEQQTGRADAPPTPRQRQLLEILYNLPAGKALNGKQVVAMVRGMNQSDLTSRVVRGLRSDGWSIPNRPRVGYYLSEGDRNRYTRMRADRNGAGT